MKFKKILPFLVVAATALSGCSLNLGLIKIEDNTTEENGGNQQEGENEEGGGGQGQEEGGGGQGEGGGGQGEGGGGESGGGEDLKGYYEGINTNSSTLLKDLNGLNSKKRKSTVGYKNMPSKYTTTDKGSGSGEVMAFYAGTSAKYSGNMNREHVWPNSLGGSSVENDIHMPRPTYSDDNGSRGNEYYVEGKRGPAKPYQETGWDPGAFSDQDASYRGDSARIIFYCCIANTNLKLVDTNGESKPGNTMGKLSDLLKWNLKYPVQKRETDRNDAIEGIQGNRNPFIDHPEFACKIWGNYNNATKAICGGNY